MERLQKIIAASGICSRRAAEELITRGSVRVNKTVITDLGTKVSPEDEILVHGKPLPKVNHIVYAVHKPRGVVCSKVQQGTAPLVTSLVPPYPPVFPIGRLDRDSEGLILLTNDGALSNRLTHPSFDHKKEYWIVCKAEKGKLIDAEKVKARFLKGVKLGDGKAVADTVEVRSEGDSFIITMVVHEGRQHLIRRMCATQNLEVVRLKRVKIASIELGTLKIGTYRMLTSAEMNRLND